MQNTFLPMNLQLFADAPSDGQQGSQAGQKDGAQGAQGTTQGQQSSADFDYDKLASIISGKQKVAEETVLKNYFKQKGLSAEEAESAINAFKEQKKKNEPDVAALEKQASDALKAAQEAAIEREGILIGIEMGLDAKSVPYIMKMADVSNVIDQEGKVDADALKKSLGAVLDAIPALKPSRQDNPGIQQFGSPGSNNENNNDDLLAGIFGNQKG